MDALETVLTEHAPDREAFWCRVAGAMQARAMLEIGVWKGTFARTILANCPTIERYYMLDPWRHLEDWNKPFNVAQPAFNDVFDEAMRRTSFAGERREILRGTSSEVIGRIPDGSLDIAYVDGDHTLRGIAIDLALAYGKVRPGGVLGGDDYTASVWQHGGKFEPSLVCPFASYFAESVGATMIVASHEQFAIVKPLATAAAVFRYVDATGRYGDRSLIAHLRGGERAPFVRRVFGAAHGDPAAERESMSAARLRLAIACALLVSSAPALERVNAAPAAGTRPIEVARIFDKHPLGGNLPFAIDWSPDGRRFLYVRRDDAGMERTHVYDMGTRRDAIFLRTKANGKGSRPAPEFRWSPDGTTLAFLDDGDLWLIGGDGNRRRRLARDADDPQWSPDGTKIAYVHANDLYAVGLGGDAPVRYSFDGSASVSNGDPDWVYSEEFSMAHAYRWASDSRRIAYLQFDQRPIAVFKIFDYLAPQGHEIADQRYPLAGGRNSIVTLRVAQPGGRTVTLYSTRSHDDYVVSVGWTPRGDPAAQLLDRAQKTLRYVEYQPDGSATTLLSEHDRFWVDVFGPPRWLAGGRRFVFASARDGVVSLYVGNRATGAVRRLTHGFRIGVGHNGDGNGDDGVLAIDGVRGTVVVSAAYPSRSDETALEVPLAGGVPKPLANGAGVHEFYFAHDGRRYVRADSTFTKPPVFSAGVVGGGAWTFVRPDSLGAYALGSVDRGTLDSKFGKLDYWMIKPPGFDPSKRYPVVMYVYGGPASPTTTDGWGGTLYLYHQELAERGYIVFSVDGPGSVIDSMDDERLLYHALGPASLAGQLAGVDFLRSLPYVDGKRLGIWGWSFGGYETTYALTHAPQTWKAGVAVAPVTDWRFYDSVYTERFMGTPHDDPAAYARSSSVDAAGRLRARLLISHGTSDDNVHLTNTIAFTQALVLADRQVDLMLFPEKTHSISGIPQRRDLFTHMLRYWQEHL